MLPKPVKDVDELRQVIGPEKLLAVLDTAEPLPAAGEPAGDDWQAIFSAGTVTAGELHVMELPQHALLLDQWMAEGDLGFVFAVRGVGKTHLSLGMARALAEGRSVGPWRASGVVPVLYVDGEMNAEQIRERDAGLASGDGELHYLNHEILFNRTGKTLNLTRPECQQALTNHCVALGVRVMFLDNLSVLFAGIAENDNDAWEFVLPWLLHLRRLGITVVIVAHAGRNGNMRGASRREDAAAWVLRLDDALDAATVKRGAKFISTFTKPSRHTAVEVPAYEWEFSPNPTTGKCDVTWKVASGIEVFLQWIADGVDQCREIAEEMHITKGTVSKLAKKAEAAGRIRIVKRRYFLADGNEEPEK